MTSALTTSLMRALRRATLRSAAADLSHEFVDVILPMMPELAEPLMRALSGAGFGETFLLMHHAPLLAAHAYDLFVERVRAVQHLPARVETLAAGGAGVAPHARGPLRAQVMSAIAAIDDPGDRACALMAWAQHEPDDPDALWDEAFARLTRASVDDLRRAAALFGDAMRPAHRDALAAEMARRGDAATPDLLEAQASVSPPEVRPALWAESLRRAGAEAGSRALGLVGTAPYALLSPWIDAHLRELDPLDALWWLLRCAGDHMSPAQLDVAAQRARDVDEVTPEWTAEVFAELARRHPTRRDELITVALEALDELFDEEYEEDDPDGFFRGDLDVLRVEAALRVSAALDGDARRALQSRALDTLAAMDSGYEHHHELDAIHWDDHAPEIDPTLREEAARVVVAMRHRPSALRALGMLVAAWPDDLRHLALLGLPRLADGGAPEGLPLALDALARGDVGPAPMRAQPRLLDDPSSRDVEHLEVLRGVVLGRSDPSERFVIALGSLSAHGARRAAAWLLGRDPSWSDHPTIRALIDLPTLQRTTEREDLIARMLRPASDQSERPYAAHLPIDAEQLARWLLTVCVDEDPVWAPRLAEFFDKNYWSLESLLPAIAHLAPVLRRLGGVESVRAVTAALRDPAPTLDFARPWANVGVGGFDA